MEYWKLGCRWGPKRKGYPLFLDILQKHNIVISWEDKDYGINTPVLLTDGHTTIAYGITKSTAKTINEFPHITEDLEEKKISMDYGLRLYEANIYLIPIDLQFQYSLVQGICEIQQYDIIEKFIEIINKDNKMENLKKNINLLNYKKQIFLQGPPGTGKTREAKFIAKEMLGLSSTDELKNNEQYEIVQFHPSYSYEDFIEGLKPTLSKEKHITYEPVMGSFKRFCIKALLSCISNIQSETVKDDDFNTIYNQYVEYINTRTKPFYFLTKNNVELVLEAATENSITVKYRYSNKEKTKPGSNPFIISKNKLLRVVQEEIKPDEIKSIKSDLFPITGHISGELFAVYRDLCAYMESKKIELSEVDVMDHDYEQVVDLYRIAKAERKLNFDKKFVFVIDEINRANLSSVLGELIYALEYRGEGIKSIYSPDDTTEFIIPPNLYIIGTMNTSDRSVGHIDYAIRRRFAFVDVLPKQLKDDDEISFRDDIFKIVSELFIKNYETYLENDKIELVPSDHLFSDFKPQDVWLGHSYFIQKKEKNDNGEEVLVPETFSIRIQYEIIPILEEYIKDGILKESAREIIKVLKTTAESA